MLNFLCMHTKNPRDIRQTSLGFLVALYKLFYLMVALYFNTIAIIRLSTKQALKKYRVML